MATKRKWSKKYKKSIKCNKPKGFSQKQHCKYGKKRKTLRGGIYRISPQVSQEDMDQYRKKRDEASQRQIYRNQTNEKLKTLLTPSQLELHQTTYKLEERIQMYKALILSLDPNTQQENINTLQWALKFAYDDVDERIKSRLKHLADWSKSTSEEWWYRGSTQKYSKGKEMITDLNDEVAQLKRLLPPTYLRRTENYIRSKLGFVKETSSSILPELLQPSDQLKYGTPLQSVTATSANVLPTETESSPTKTVLPTDYVNPVLTKVLSLETMGQDRLTREQIFEKIGRPDDVSYATKLQTLHDEIAAKIASITGNSNNNKNRKFYLGEQAEAIDKVIKALPTEVSAQSVSP